MAKHLILIFTLLAKGRALSARAEALGEFEHVLPGLARRHRRRAKACARRARTLIRRLPRPLRHFTPLKLA